MLLPRTTKPFRVDGLARLLWGHLSGHTEGTLAPCSSTRTHRVPVTHGGEHVTKEVGVSVSLPKGRGQESKEELGGSWVTRAVPRGSSDCDACEHEAGRKKQTFQAEERGSVCKGLRRKSDTSKKWQLSEVRAWSGKGCEKVRRSGQFEVCVCCP